MISDLILYIQENLTSKGQALLMLLVLIATITLYIIDKKTETKKDGETVK